MKAIRHLLGWLGRKAVLYIALVVAIGLATMTAPWVRQVAAGTTPTQVRAQVLENANGSIAAERDAATRAFAGRVGSLRTQSLADLAERERQLRAERAALAGAIGAAKPAWVLALADREELIANERRKLRVALIDQELPVIVAAFEAVGNDGAAIAAQADLSTQQRIVVRAVPACNNATKQMRDYEDRWLWQVRRWWESRDHKQLVRVRDQRCAAARAAMARRDRLLAVAQARLHAQHTAQSGFRQAARATDLIRHVSADLAQDAERARIELSGSVPQKLRLWSERLGLAAILHAAAIALALIVAMPFLIRLLCFFVLAPLAMRRPMIRLPVRDGAGTLIAPAPRSATSVAVRLAPGEELLVRQDYLQTSSHAGGKSTQWFLDWKKPVTSFATGLTFLTKIRGNGEVTTVSAVRDGLAEVTILILPEGASCVLQPRALAAVAQPIHRRLRITRHWRLTSLNAWLTLQLRYLIFHGPARLVLKGGRGVRVEPAEHGRVFGQDQLVGFSADLAYSVTRTETFWPYFLGREQLLKDRVLAGDGVLIVEEAPLTARRGSGRRGLEGMIDAGMKVFGM
jgi:uncharacterized protein (AIM24 family)